MRVNASRRVLVAYGRPKVGLLWLAFFSRRAEAARCIANCHLLRGTERGGSRQPLSNSRDPATVSWVLGVGGPDHGTRGVISFFQTAYLHSQASRRRNAAPICAGVLAGVAE